MRLAGSVAALIVAGASLQAWQSPDAATVLSEMRRALGGEQALQSISSLSVSGSEERSASGRSLAARVEFACILPDRCLMVRRVPTPFGSDTIESHGFNGATRIRRRESNAPYPPDPFAHESADQRAERARRAALDSRREFARFLVPLIGLTALDSVKMTYESEQDFDGKKALVVALQAADGYEARLFVDAAAHRPAGLSWMAIPPIVISTTSIETVRGRTIASWPMPPGDPAAGVARVEHQLLYSDFKTQDGLTLPRRFKQVVNGKTIIDTRLGAYRINPQLDPAWFDPSR